MHTFRLTLRMLLRDLRAGELHLLGLAIVIAVASLTSVGFLADRVARGLDREANQLLGGDLLLRADHPWDDAVAAEAARRGLRSVETVLFTSMVGTEEGAELAAVKVVESGYPLRGNLRIARGRNQPDAVASGVPEPGEVWLDERLFATLGISVGDSVGLGRLQLRAGAVLTFESDRGANFFSLLPRAMFNAADLEASGLLIEGSRANWRLHVAGAPEPVEAFAAWAQARLERGQAVETIDNARPEVRGALDQAQRFLRLAALLAVVLAAVAVALSARRFMRRHLDGCAVMRCLGARQSQVMCLVVGEFMLVGAVAAVLGAGVGWGVQILLGAILADAFGAVLPTASLAPFGHGVVVAMVLVLGFVLPQVLRLGRVSTLRVLRRELVPVESRSAAAWLAGSAALLAIILWIANEPRLGALVAGGFVAALAIFALSAWLVLLLLARLRGGRTLRGSGWRYGIAAVVRRSGTSIIQICALGTGLTALVLLTLIRGDLLDNWRRLSPPDAPNRFIINIQPDQREALTEFFAARGVPAPAILPMIRGRMVAINGSAVRPDAYENPRTRRLAEREFNLSHASALPTGNAVVAGRWHGADATPQFSVENGLAETFGLKLGDRVRFEVAGRVVEAPITSVRELEWDSMRVNFFFIAAPGMLESDPASLITSFRIPPGEHAMTAALVERFPNLSVIDVDAVIAQVRAMTDKLVLVVQFVFGFSLVAGVAVLLAALQATQDERAHELAVLRTLGARNRQLRHAVVAEFLVLGALASGLGVAAAAAIGWALAHFAFRMPYLPEVTPLLMVAAAAALAVVSFGWSGTSQLLRRCPMDSIRAAD